MGEDTQISEEDLVDVREVVAINKKYCCCCATSEKLLEYIDRLRVELVSKRRS